MEPEQTTDTRPDQPLKTWLLVSGLALLLLVAIACVLTSKWGPLKVVDRKDGVFADRYLAYVLHNFPVEKDSASVEAGGKRLEEVFNKRLEQYEKNADALSRQLLYLAVFICLALTAILRRKATYKIPVLDLALPRDAALLIIPAGLLVLWSQFGFLLSETIDLRMGLWRIAEALEAPQRAIVDKDLSQTPSLTGAVQLAWLDVTNSKYHFTSNDWYNAAYTFGHKRVLHDGGFMDGWFNSFRIQETLPAKSGGIVVCVVVLWGIFCGLANALILACIWERGKRAFPPWERFCFSTLFIGTTGYLLLSHWGFMWGGGHRNWMQPVSLLACTLTLWILAARGSIPRTIVRIISRWFPGS